MIINFILSRNIIIINTDTEQNILQGKGKGLCCWSGDRVCREWRWSFAGGPESRQQHKPIYSDVCKYLSQWQIYIWVASFTRFCNSEMSKRNKDCLFGSSCTVLQYPAYERHSQIIQMSNIA